MKQKIGIFGSAVDDNPQVLDKARELGSILAKHDVIFVSGATTGISDVILGAAKEQNPDIEVWGYPAFQNRKALSVEIGESVELYSKLVFIQDSFPFKENVGVSRKYRNVISTATVDAGIIVSGRWGTLNEFTNLHDMGKVIGVLTETGGIADALPDLYKKIYKPGKAVVIFKNSPQKLVSDILDLLSLRH